MKFGRSKTKQATPSLDQVAATLRAMAEDARNVTQAAMAVKGAPGRAMAAKLLVELEPVAVAAEQASKALIEAMVALQLAKGVEA